MKNKKLLYILFPLVALLWGLIFFKIFTHLKGDNDNYIPENYLVESKLKSITDTFSLIANYNDPFQRSFSENLITRETSIIPKERKNEKAEIYIQWPDINFGGLIINDKGKYKTALIKINYKDYILKTGDINEGVKIEAIYQDSIKLSFQKQIKIFYKQN